MNRARGPVSEPAELLEEPVRSRAVELAAPLAEPPLAGRPAGQQPAGEEIPRGKVASPSPSASMAVPLRGSREGTAGPLVRAAVHPPGRSVEHHLVDFALFHPLQKELSWTLIRMSTWTLADFRQDLPEPRRCGKEFAGR